MSKRTPTAVEFGGNLFVNADCVAGALEFLADSSVDLIVTDPPYGINGGRLDVHYNRDERFVVDGYIDVPARAYARFSERWIAQAERVLRPGGQMYVVSGYTNLYDVLGALRKTRLREINHLIWKYNFGVYTSAKFVSSHYHILYYAKPGKRRIFNLESRYGLQEVLPDGGSANYRDREDVWHINREYKPGREKNKNELPKSLLQKMLQYSSDDGDLVCDFFLGGGSTAAVALGMNRRFVGFELSREIFRRRVPALRAIEPGSMLTSLRSPVREASGNRGKRWQEEDVRKTLARYSELVRAGEPKGKAVETLGAELGRGSWAIQRLLKLHRAEQP